MLETVTHPIEQVCGIVPHAEYQLIDQRQRGCLTTTLAWKAEVLRGQAHVLLCVTSVKPGHRCQRAFAWPVADPQRPVEVFEIAERIVRAAEPGAVIHDPRNPVGRLFDRLIGSTLVNHLPDLAQHNETPPAKLSATIRSSRLGVIVTLVHRVHRRSPLWLHLPLESIEALRERAKNNL